MWKLQPSISWRVVELICNEYDLSFPTDDVTLSTIEQEFRSRPEMGALKGCVGCIDGLLVKIRAPSNSETYHSRRYHSRKEFYALSMQAVSDVHGRFLLFEVQAPGGMNDTQAFELMDLKVLLESGKLSAGYWIAGDAAYTCSDHMIGPYIGNLTEEQDNFNWAQSQLRIRVEMAFGKYVGRWGILWKPLRMHHGQAGVIAMCCVKLQNIVISYDLEHQQFYSEEEKSAFTCTTKVEVDGTFTDMQEDLIGAARRRGGAHSKRQRSAALMKPPTIGENGCPVENLNDQWHYTARRRTSRFERVLLSRCARCMCSGRLSVRRAWQ